MSFKGVTRACSFHRERGGRERAPEGCLKEKNGEGFPLGTIPKPSGGKKSWESLFLSDEKEILWGGGEH